jgi:hypothetical protein
MALRTARADLVDRTIGWWDRAVLNRRDWLLDWWDAAVADPLGEWRQRLGDRRARASDRLLDEWEAAAARRVSLRLAVVIVVGAALAGLGTAALIGQGAGAAAVEEQPPASAPPAPSSTKATQDQAVGRRIATVVRALGVDRARGRQQLRASQTGRGQAAAARSVAHAYRASALTLATIPGDQAKPLVPAVRRAGAAYEALARGADAGDRGRYHRAAGQIARAEADLQRILRRPG